MGSTIKCPAHRETKIETLVEKGYKQYYISRYCFSCWLEQEYKKEIEKYEEKLKEYKSKWLNIFEFPSERPNSYEFKKRYRGYANHGKSNVNAFKEELRQEYYRRNTPADFNVVLRLNGVEFENYIEALFKNKGLVSPKLLQLEMVEWI